MSNKLRPNFTQVPNYILDVLLPELTYPEAIVLIFLCRKLYGWHKEDKGDKISLSQFVEGTPGKETSIKTALNSLEQKGIIKKISFPKRPSLWFIDIDQKISSRETNNKEKSNSREKTIRQSGNDHDPVETQSGNDSTKESNINKLIKENKSDAMHLEKQNNNFSIHKEIQKIYEIGFFDITKEKIDFTGENGKLIGSHIKSLIVKGESKYRSITNKGEKQRLAYLEVRRRSAILFKLIDGGDKYFGGFEFLPWVLVKFWNKFAIEKTKLSKRELKESEIDEMVKSI